MSWLQQQFTAQGVVIGIIVTVLASTLSVFASLYLSRAIPEVYFSRSTVQVYDTQNSAPGIRVLDESGNLIETDVFASEFTIWNGGAETLTSEQVRKPIELIATAGTKILDYQVIEQIEKDVALFTLTPVESGEVERLSLAWKHFDPGFGAKIKVVYAASSEAEVSLDGYVYKFGPIQSYDAEKKSISRIFLWMIGGALVFDLIIIIFGMEKMFNLMDKHIKRYQGLTFVSLFTFLLAIPFAVLILFQKFIFLPPEPPLL